MSTLYELTGQYLEVQNLDMPDEDLTDTLAGLEGEIELKAENLLAVVSNIGSNISAIDGEIKRLQARKQVITNRQDRLKNYLRENMEVSGIDKITCPLFTITLRKPTQAVEVDDVDSLDSKYRRVTVMPDKAAIKAALRVGEKIPGCRLIDGKRGLLIK